jgi:hypothetical protein
MADRDEILDDPEQAGLVLRVPAGNVLGRRRRSRCDDDC